VNRGLAYNGGQPSRSCFLMAISLLVALIALGLLHAWPKLAGWHAGGLFRRWVAQLSDASGIGRVVVALLLPLAICALLQWLFGRSPLGGLLQLGLALVVLIYCLGPRGFEADLEAIIQAPDQPAREAAAQALHPGHRRPLGGGDRCLEALARAGRANQLVRQRP
jgi:AmpE protein